MTTAPKVFAIHENPEWFGPFAAALDARGVPYEEWLLTDGVLEIDEAPPEGIFWSRISASAHTRDHALSKDYTRALMSWLEAHGRRTVNGRRTIELEVSKVDQLTALRAAGIEVPRTRAVIGSHRIVEAAQGLPTPFITKHNQGGKGLGVRRFDSVEELAAYGEGPDFEEPQDGITLLQEFLEAATPRVTRVEIVGGRFVYAIQADTARGGYQLCPADACAIDPTTGALVMPPGATIAQEPGDTIFSLREDITAEHPLVQSYVAFLAGLGIEVAGIEFIETADGRLVTYDVNTNTNYNAGVEAVAPASGPGAVAELLERVLRETYPEG
ncbi:ATP-grasp domain-containing protein [Clavibacter michiganensis]|uniref:Alpha-L-glutamate ligase n=1 Tax=Clavibacter michiganensis subsp. insidiosus TaxID=33014 RepID=A0A0D5CF75_9MICO|nr:alpha-L-glutamate ligase [Clavibacter michiganensis]AJW78271.1 alpha-L-glutamate ligase [Clavibacter michiganensis subsp. insidiosus]AWF99317.1 alpha-L-glutamate ligase [Clavibacter michiganensis subsp. insidiosus]AWG00567.1 alpha-L-glutamate ligase [Clavibacter michiganensis subsp. insidiosus]OQJ60819.1 alpha-L-glutamate ligase [Clavibacter michiganensis subsp. insidiosus]RII86549.1 alpha-L-glutamate ligase [Clavibacter michiganensis subsp. insidiosus]